MNNETPLDVAMRNGQREIAVQLLKAGGKSAVMPLPPLHFALASSLAQGDEENIEIVKQMVNEQTVREKDKENNTPLHIAAGSGNLSLVQLVCQYDVDVNAKINKVKRHYCLLCRQGMWMLSAFYMNVEQIRRSPMKPVKRRYIKLLNEILLT